MPDLTTPTHPVVAAKPPWRFASERRLGRVARQLLGHAEAEIPWALGVLGVDDVLDVTRREQWALSCLERAALCDDGSEAQAAWVILAASRPRLVRQAAARAKGQVGRSASGERR